MSVLMLCGYKGSGKDTFYQDLCAGTLHTRWNIYGKNSPFMSTTKYTRVAFADRLKTYTIDKYGLDETVCKDDIVDDTGATFRDLLIREGKLTRRTSPDKWTETALSEYTPRADIPLCITDWRFNHEYDYVVSRWMPNHRPDAHVITARIVRTDVPVPSEGDTSERELDAYTTEYLVVAKQDNLQDVLPIFPQYRWDVL